MIDMLNKTYNYYTVIDGPMRKNNKLYWLCRCKCGTEKWVYGGNLRNGTTKSCGCYKNDILIQNNIKRQTLDLTNKQFGKLIAIELTDKRSADGRVIWKCQCECGNITYIDSHSLQEGKTKSCGCLVWTGEYTIQKLLENNNIEFEIQKTFPNCKFLDTGYEAKFDFFINNKYIIEYDGQQHYYYKNNNTWNNKQNFDKVQEHDKYKNNWCKENNIPLIRIPYTQLQNLKLEDLLLETSQFRVNW